MFGIFFFYSCEKDHIIPDSSVENLIIDNRSNNENPFSNNWATGSYLVFADADEISSVYNQLVDRFDDTNYDVLDSFEESRDFYSMRRTYDEYQNYALDEGADLSQIVDRPIFSDVLSSMISVDGIVQVGTEIQYFSQEIYAKAPISEKNRLKQIVVDGEVMTPNDVSNGIDITPRTSSFCNASFNFTVNHSTFEVDVVYTGDSPNGEDKFLTWNVGSNNNNQLNFTHQFDSPGTKEICATYVEREIFQDTVCVFLPATRDSTFTTSSGQDTTVTISFFEERCIPFNNVKVGCTSTICRDINIGGCTANFSTNIGIDNVVNFVNLSSSPNGVITGYQWNFGDGQTSTEVNPTHTYECDRDYNVNLIIFSPQCPGGQATVSQTISASGVNCCDSNPSSNWKIKEHPTDEDKRIRYRYDMGSAWEWFNDQDFKGKIEYWENRRGGIFGSKRWRKTEGMLDVNFSGSVFAEDEEQCECQDPRNLEASPPNIEARTHTFKDPLANTALSNDKLWLKQSSPVFIDWMVDGVLYLRQEAQFDPAFECD